LAASFANAQTLPVPERGKSYVVRDLSGKAIERLVSENAQFRIVAAPGQERRTGWAKRRGTQLVFYDEAGRVTGAARQELLPPDAPISAMATVRDPLGNPIGFLTRY